MYETVDRPSATLRAASCPGPARAFDLELPRGPIVDQADELFDRLCPYSGPGLRNHCLRMFHFASALAGATRIQRDLAYLIAMVHDLGLVVVDDGVNYLERTRAVFWREAASMVREQDRTL